MPGAPPHPAGASLPHPEPVLIPAGGSVPAPQFGPALLPPGKGPTVLPARPSGRSSAQSPPSAPPHGRGKPPRACPAHPSVRRPPPAGETAGMLPGPGLQSALSTAGTRCPLTVLRIPRHRPGSGASRRSSARRSGHRNSPGRNNPYRSGSHVRRLP